jgi:hypothetical protein
MKNTHIYNISNVIKQCCLKLKGSIVDDVVIKDIRLKDLDEKQYFLKVFPNDDIPNLFVFADINSDSLNFDFVPEASTKDYLIIVPKKHIKFSILKESLKKLNLKFNIIKSTLRNMYDINELNVKPSKVANDELYNIVASVIERSIFSYKPRVKRQTRSKGKTKIKRKTYYRKNKPKIKRQQKVYRKKNKPRLKQRKKLKHYKRRP